PFYSAKLRAAGIATCPSTLDEYFATVPFTTKAELIDNQIAHPPYGTNLTYPLEAYTRFHQTSGTMGPPIRWLDTRASSETVLDCWTRIYQTAGLGAHDRIFFPFSFGPFLGFWGAFDAATRMGCLAIAGGGMRSTARIQALLDNQVTALCTTPTYALRLAEV